MLEDNVVAATKRMVTNTSDVGRDNRNKRKRSRDDQDKRGKHDSKESRQSSHRNVVEWSVDRPAKNLGQDSNVEPVRFMVQPSELLPLIQSL